MQVYSTIGEVSLHERTAAALGFFDGLHIGHAAVIERAAAQEGLSPCVFTFTMRGKHPAGKMPSSRLITDSKKYSMLKKWGIEIVLSPDFSEFHEMEPRMFVDEVLVRRLHVEMVCCGDDFRFGCRASAGVDELEQLCRERGIRLEIVPPVTCHGERVSSTRIRQLLAQGEVEAAAELLGRAFSYDFMVVHGKKLGRTIDSPTINQRMPNDFVLLRHGVYASAARVDGRLLPAVTNIGLRPTVENSGAVNSETYICGFSGDLYGQNVEVRLLHFIRPEQKFPDLDALRRQIQADAQACLPIADKYIQSRL